MTRFHCPFNIHSLRCCRIFHFRNCSSVAEPLIDQTRKRLFVDMYIVVEHMVRLYSLSLFGYNNKNCLLVWYLTKKTNSRVILSSIICIVARPSWATRVWALQRASMVCSGFFFVIFLFLPWAETTLQYCQKRPRVLTPQQHLRACQNISIFNIFK